MTRGTPPAHRDKLSAESSGLNEWFCARPHSCKHGTNMDIVYSNMDVCMQYSDSRMVSRAAATRAVREAAAPQEHSEAPRMCECACSLVPHVTCLQATTVWRACMCRCVVQESWCCLDSRPIIQSCMLRWRSPKRFGCSGTRRCARKLFDITM